ncbi:MAG: hypothetical protein ACJ8AW_30600 [Rhodopila sp.]
MSPVKSVAVSIAIAILTACSKTVPSDAEIQAQLVALYDGCPLMTITDFHRINGMVQRDRSYVVAVSYTLHLAPTNHNRDAFQDYARTDEPRLVTYRTAAQQHDEVRRAIDAKRQQCRELATDNARVLDTHYAAVSYADARYQNYLERHPKDDPTALALAQWLTDATAQRDRHQQALQQVEHACSDEVAALRQANAAILADDPSGQYAQRLRALGQLQAAMRADYEAQCRFSLTGPIIPPLVHVDDAIAAYGTAHSVDVQLTVVFVKTDNGWMLTRRG